MNKFNTLAKRILKEEGALAASMGNDSKYLKKGQLMLHVWENVLTDYTSGMAFAIASSKQEAAILAISGGFGWDVDENNEHVKELLSTEEPDYKVYPINKPYGNSVTGGS